MKENQQLSRERDQVVRDYQQLRTANTIQDQQLRQQVSDSDIIVQWSLSSPSAVSHENC